MSGAIAGDGTTDAEDLPGKTAVLEMKHVDLNPERLDLVEQIRRAAGQDDHARLEPARVEVAKSQVQLELHAARVELGDQEKDPGPASGSPSHWNTLRLVARSAAGSASDSSACRLPMASL